MMDDRPWFPHYDAKVPRHINIPAVPVFESLEQAARKHPDRACTIFKGAVITYAEMNCLTDELAAGLASLGVRKGQPVGIFMPNTPQFIMAFFAILKAGGVVVATNPLYTPRELEHQLKDSGIELMLVTSNFYQTVNKARPHSKLKTCVVTNIKEYLPAHLRLLFTLFREKREGHRVDLAPGDLWLQDVLNSHRDQPRPSVEVEADSWPCSSTVAAPRACQRRPSPRTETWWPTACRFRLGFRKPMGPRPC